MMASMVRPVCAIAALLMTSAASAVTITNRDGIDIKVVVIEGSAKQDIVLQAGKGVEGVCQKGCIIRLNDSDNEEYELDGSETVAVEEGFLYYDGSPLERAPYAGSAAPADKPNPK